MKLNSLTLLIIVCFTACLLIPGCSESSTTSMDVVQPTITVEAQPTETIEADSGDTSAVASEETSIPEKNAPDINALITLSGKYDGYAGYTPKPGFGFLFIELSLENNGDESFKWDFNQVKIIDENGDEWSVLDELTFGANIFFNPFEECTIDAGETKSGQIAFGVPEETYEYALNIYGEDGTLIESVDLPKNSGIEIKVTKKEKYSSVLDKQPNQGGIFLFTALSITNNEKDSLHFDPDLMMVTDVNGKDYPVLQLSFIKGAVLYPLTERDIKPGYTTVGGLIFGVPIKTETYTLSLYDESGDIVATADVGTVLS